jgi:hypothetical protein
VPAVPVGAAQASTPFGARSAASIVAAASAAMARAGAVDVVGTGPADVSGVGSAVLHETLYAGASSGTQSISTSGGSVPAADLPSASVSVVDGALYTNASAAFWNGLGAPGATAALLSGKWIEIPTDSSLYGPIAADLTMPSLITDLFAAQSYRKGKPRTVDGTSVIPIAYTATGVDAGPTTCYVAATGKHLPVEVVESGMTLRFRSWGKTQVVVAPPDAVPLPSLLPPSGPGAGTITV